MSGLLAQLVQDKGIECVSITHRPKDRSSFLRKVERPDAGYENLEDITDLAGIRLITYYEDDVDRIADMIETEFDVDVHNTVDKRSELNPTEFGYISLHYVVQLANNRKNLAEYQQFGVCKAEIQIRSVLQHAWAEIEHDLGYKTETSIPSGERRRFSRLAGLLEIADSEFMALRDRLVEYERDVPSKIADNPDNVALDLASYRAFVRGQEVPARIALAISDALGTNIETDDDDDLSRQLHRFDRLGIETIGELRSEAERVEQGAIKLASQILGGGSFRGNVIGDGTGMSWVAHVLAGESKMSVEDFADYMNPRSPNQRHSGLVSVAKRILDAIAELGLGVPI